MATNPTRHSNTYILLLGVSITTQVLPAWSRHWIESVNGITTGPVYVSYSGMTPTPLVWDEVWLPGIGGNRRILAPFSNASVWIHVPTTTLGTITLLDG